jgi:hypothetical protein
LQAKNILIAVGGKPQKLAIPGAEHCITSDEALELEDCPKKVVVLGGGYIALEFAGIFKRFGSDVHVVYRADLPLRGFDEEVSRGRSVSVAIQGRLEGGAGLGRVGVMSYIYRQGLRSDWGPSGTAGEGGKGCTPTNKC